MLKAVSRNGTVLNFADHLEDLVALKELRKTTDFYCPSCNSSVVMRLGQKKVWHFAHHSHAPCVDAWEAESSYHLSGKEQLYNWLRKEHRDVEVETYLQQPKKRPDLFLQARNLAIEYQCSPIEENLLQHRTDSYFESGVDVWWILGKSRLKSKYRFIHSISSMEWASTRIVNQTPVLFYYCPLETLFYIVIPQYSLTSTKIICTTTAIAPDKTSLAFILKTPLTALSHPIRNSIWLKQKQIWRTNPHGEKSYAYYYIRKLLYEKGEAIRLFPSEVGIPSTSNYWIETPSYLWQAWIVLVFLPKLHPHMTFTFTQLTSSFKELISRGIFKLRMNSFEMGVNMALHAYLEQLKRLNVIKERGDRYEKVHQPLMNNRLETALVMDKKIILDLL
ncbi:competence protein CoiA [Alkalihalobacillus sp. R86527]|uniref:competence protein CoiA n=1 Tax=Alkalihalobacillus sp. R86527 TaxID=3093863 RepID=UPI00366CE5F8